jgi:hypothetical protein
MDILRIKSMLTDAVPNLPSELVVWLYFHFQLNNGDCVVQIFKTKVNRPLGHNAVLSRWSKQTFKRCALPASGRCWWRQYALLKRRSTSTRVQCASSEKAVIFILAVVRIWNLTCLLSSIDFARIPALTLRNSVVCLIYRVFPKHAHNSNAYNSHINNDGILYFTGL